MATKPKKENSTGPANYHPISVTSIICKIIERLVMYSPS